MIPEQMQTTVGHCRPSRALYKSHRMQHMIARGIHIPSMGPLGPPSLQEQLSIHPEKRRPCMHAQSPEGHHYRRSHEPCPSPFSLLRSGASRHRRSPELRMACSQPSRSTFTHQGMEETISFGDCLMTCSFFCLYVAKNHSPSQK